MVFRAVREGEEEGTPVALKVLRHELADDASYVRRFAREGEVALAVDHPNLVRVLEHGEACGRLYLASRYVPGPTLAERLDRGPLSARAAARAVADVGAGLDALHRLGLVHRDVKPANVLFDADGRALLTDFGVARGAAHETLTKTGRVVGTIDYLAPELIRGERATSATDIYALGCLAYEALTGAPPFGDRPVADACLAHLREAPADPAAAGVPPELAALVVTALAKDASRRPATGSAYGRLLRAAARAR